MHRASQAQYNERAGMRGSFIHSYTRMALLHIAVPPASSTIQVKSKAPAEQQITVELNRKSLYLTFMQMHGSVAHRCATHSAGPARRSRGRPLLSSRRMALLHIAVPPACRSRGRPPLSSRAIQVKNKAPAERQITVEHILRESKEIQLEVRQEALPGMPG
eukprot:1157757-Pelagomonas_calceolata.AAC.8